MVFLFDFETEQVADIPQESVTDAVASGRFGFRKGGRIPVVSPAGKIGSVPAERAHQAFKDGFRYEGEEAARARQIRTDAAASPGTAFAFAAGDSALFGLPSQIIAHGDRSGRAQAQMRALREENPIATTLGAVAGTVAGLTPAGLVVGAAGKGLARLGAKAAVKAGVSAAETLGSRVLHGAASGALRGAGEEAVFGATQLVSEEAIGRAEFNAEGVIAYVGGGALLGTAGGAVFGLAAPVVKAGAGAVAQKLAGGRIGDALSEFARQRALRVVTGKQKKAVDVLAQKGIKRQAQDYIENQLGLKLGDSTESMAVKLEARSAELGEELGDIARRLDDATATTPVARVSPAAVADRIEREVLSQYKGIAAAGATESAVQREIDAIRKLGDNPLSFTEARRQRAAVQDAINYQVEGKATARAKKSIARAWNDEIDVAAAPVLQRLGEDSGRYKALRREYALVSDLSKFNQNSIRSNENLNIFSVGDVAIGAATGTTVGGPAGLVAGLAGATARKGIRKYGDAAVSVAARKLANLNALSKAAQATGARVDSAVGRLVQDAPRAGRAALAVAFSRTIFDGLMPGGGAAESLTAAVKARAAEIDTLLADPDGLADRVASALVSLDEAAPMTSGHMAQKAVQIAQFLQSKAPRDPYAGTGLQPQIDEWQPSPSEASRFARYYAAAMDPLSVIDEIAAGTVTREGVETLRALYPEIFEMTQIRLAAKAAEISKRIPYTDRILLSELFGVALDPTMRPESIARSQSLYGKKEQPQGQAGGGNRLGGLGKIKKVTNQGKTATQRLEERQ